MPCSVCRQSGHNIRTCPQGPTPGGVNGLRARSGYSSGSSPSIFSPNFSTSLFSNESALLSIQKSSVRSFGTNNFENDETYSPNTLSDVKRLIQRVDDKIDKELENFQEKTEKEFTFINKQLAKMEQNSRKNLENYDKLVDKMEIAKNDIIKHIDSKFQDMYDKFEIVEKKLIDNEQKIEKNSEEIDEIKQHVMENQEKEKYKPTDAKEEKLLEPEEMIELFREMMTSLKNCKTKQDQFEVIIELGMKYINQK